MHELVHDEGCASHVSGIFQKRYEQIEYQYVRQEDQHASDTAYDTVDNQILQPAVIHCRSHECSDLLHEPLDPLHRILSEKEGRLEYHIQKEEEDRECQPFVGYHSIKLVCQCIPAFLPLIWFICLSQCALHKGVLCVHQS